MTQLQFLMDRKAWVKRMLELPEGKLPGTLTVEKIIDHDIETEAFLTYLVRVVVTPEGLKSTYADNDERLKRAAPHLF